MKRIELVYFNAGGGHRTSATALQAVIETQQRPWQLRLVDLLAILDPKDRFERLVGIRPEDLYNKRLARGWTAGMAQELKLLQGLLRFGHRPLVRQLRQHWLASEPDLVVSLIPNFNRALYDSLASSLPGVPFATILTDLADYPPNFWIEPGQAQHLVCGTPRAVEQARQAGYADRQIHRTSGMILRPDFHAPKLADRAGERRRLGLDPRRPTGLVMFGGHGSRAMLRIAARLRDLQAIFVCGHNAALAERLRALPTAAPRLIVGFTTEIPRYMDLADFFVGKPGPGSISEAIQRGLPVIVVDNGWTMPQERFNAQWIREQGVGVVHDSFRTIRRAVAETVERLDELRANVARIDNRAAFEIPEILAGILEESERRVAAWQPAAIAADARAAAHAR